MAAILAGKPDFIKTFLLFSEEFEGASRCAASPTACTTGPRPAAAAPPSCAGRTPRGCAYRRTSTPRAISSHAVEAGVDEINHTPQPDQRFSPDLSAYVIAPATARLAAAARDRGGHHGEHHRAPVAAACRADWLPAMRAMQAANLRTARARPACAIAIGSDGISGERRLRDRARRGELPRAHRMLTPLELLRVWAVDTPRTIFPQRRLGELRAGFEANFLVLNGDPLDDPDNLHRIGDAGEGAARAPADARHRPRPLRADRGPRAVEELAPAAHRVDALEQQVEVLGVVDEVEPLAVHDQQRARRRSCGSSACRPPRAARR